MFVRNKNQSMTKICYYYREIFIYRYILYLCIDCKINRDLNNLFNDCYMGGRNFEEISRKLPEFGDYVFSMSENLFSNYMSRFVT